MPDCPLQLDSVTLSGHRLDFEHPIVLPPHHKIVIQRHDTNSKAIKLTYEES